MFNLLILKMAFSKVLYCLWSLFCYAQSKKASRVQHSPLITAQDCCTDHYSHRRLAFQENIPSFPVLVSNGIPCSNKTSFIGRFSPLPSKSCPSSPTAEIHSLTLIWLQQKGIYSESKLHWPPSILVKLKSLETDSTCPTPCMAELILYCYLSAIFPMSFPYLLNINK